jgi:hypothetical protein
VSADVGIDVNLVSCSEELSRLVEVQGHMVLVTATVEVTVMASVTLRKQRKPKERQ